MSLDVSEQWVCLSKLLCSGSLLKVAIETNWCLLWEMDVQWGELVSFPGFDMYQPLETLPGLGSPDGSRCTEELVYTAAVSKAWTCATLLAHCPTCWVMALWGPRCAQGLCWAQRSQVTDTCPLNTLALTLVGPALTLCFFLSKNVSRGSWLSVRWRTG